MNFSLTLNTKLNPNRNNRLHDLNYSTLDSADQNNFELATIRNMVIKPEAVSDNLHQAMYEIFNRLNSGGMNLNSQEIRMSLYACDFMDNLSIMNKNPTWRNLIGKEKEDIRLKDCEQILRLMAMLLSGTEKNPTRYSNPNNQFKSPLTAFFNRFSEYSKCLDDEDIVHISRVWDEFFESIKSLPPHLFSNSKEEDTDAKISLPVLEAIFFACCKDYLDKNDNKVIQLTKEKISNLKKKTTFIEKSTGKTSSRANVYERLDIAYKYLKGVQ